LLLMFLLHLVLYHRRNNTARLAEAQARERSLEYHK